MNVERVTFRLKGMNDGMDVTEPGWAERIVNLTVDPDGNWRNCTDWWWLFQNTAVPPTHYTDTIGFQSMYWWGQRGTARQWLVWERAVGVSRAAATVSLEVHDGVNATVIELATGRTRFDTPHPGSTYLPISGWLYIINGYDQPVRWNGRVPDYGSELVQVGFPAPPPPPGVALAGNDVAPANAWGDGMGAGLGTSGQEWRYGYAITYLNDVGAESPPSEVSFVSGTNPTIGGSPVLQQVRVTIGSAPAHVRAIRVYRTVDLATAGSVAEGARFSLYHLRDLPAAIDVAFLDNLSDVALGHQLATAELGCFPVGAKHAAYFKGTLFLAGAPSYPDRVFYSAPGLVEQYPAANTFDLGGSTGAEITGLHATQNALVAFTRRGVHLIKGDPANGFFLETVSSEVGCIAPGAVVDVPGDQPAVIFFDVEGPYMLAPGEQSPSSLSFIGRGIRRFWANEVNVDAMLGARAARHRRDQEVIFILPRQGRPSAASGVLPAADAEPEVIGLVYHYLHGWWSLRDFMSTYLQLSTLGPTVGAIAELGDERGMVAVGSDDVYVSGVRNVFSNNDAEGTTWLYRSAWYGPKVERFSVSHVEILGHLAAVRSTDGVSKAAPKPAIGLRYRGDRKMLPEIDFEVPWDPDNDAPVEFAVTYPRPRKPNMVSPEYAADTWEESTWTATGYWQHEVPRLYPFDVRLDGYEVQWELAGGGLDLGVVTLTAGSLCITNGKLGQHGSQQRGSDRP